MDLISGASISTAIIIGVCISLLVIAFWVMSLLCRVVATNAVHVVRSKSKTVSYGTGQTDKKDEQGSIIVDPGTVYYAWPSWLPILGVDARTFPKSIFDVSLDSYEAYDKGRLPFEVNVQAFFRIDDFELAAARMNSSDELKDQLCGVLQGVVRRILATNEQVAVVKANADREVAVTKAQADKEVIVTKANGEKNSTILIAEGSLVMQKNNAEGIEAVGIAQGAADKAKLMAPVDAQITLADKIGGDDKYQAYLISVRNLEAIEKIGIANAKALENADIKAIANGGTVTEGLGSLGEIFSAKGGTKLGAMVSALNNNPDVMAVAERVLDTKGN